MSKFYAQSGSRSIVITAENACEAAHKLVDHVMGDHVWIYGDASICEEDRRAHLAMEALLTMDSEVRVSIRGQGRSEAGLFDIAELINDWHRLMTGISKMFGQAIEAQSVVDHSVDPFLQIVVDRSADPFLPSKS